MIYLWGFMKKNGRCHLNNVCGVNIMAEEKGAVQG